MQVKEVDLDSIFSISGKTNVKIEGENFEITFLGFEDYATDGFQPPYMEVHLNASTESGTSNLSIFHYLRTEKMSLEELDSISKNESSAEIGFFHESAIIDGKYALYFKNACLSWDERFIRDHMDYVKVDSARFIITKL
jgi:hypothetical protein